VAPGVRDGDGVIVGARTLRDWLELLDFEQKSMTSWEVVWETEEGRGGAARGSATGSVMDVDVSVGDLRSGTATKMASLSAMPSKSPKMRLDGLRRRLELGSTVGVPDRS